MIFTDNQKYYLYRAGLAFAAGVCMTSAFAPANMPLYAFAALVVIIYLVGQSKNVKEASIWGLSFGFGWFVTGINWVYYSMYHYGYMPLEWTYVTTVIFSLLLALFPCVAFALAVKVTRDPVMRMAATLPAAFTLAEWVRGWLLTGFPWLNPAYAMVDWPFGGLAPILGSYGVLLGTVWVAGLVGAAWVAQGQWVARASMVLMGACVVMLGLTGQSVEWAQPTGEVKARLVQPNLEPRLLRQSISERFDEVYFYLDNVTVEKAGVDVVLLPESVYPTSWQRFSPREVVRLTEWVKANQKDVLLNAFWESSNGDFSNAAILLNKDAEVTHYEKRHLVPFGEFVPYGFQWFVDSMRIPMSEQKAGDENQPLMNIAGHRVSVNICYENLFGNEWRLAFKTENPEWLINLSNLKWFGPVKAAEQHFQISRMRAMEMARPVVSVTNSGVSGVIDAKGQVVSRIPSDAEGTLDVTVATMTGEATPYVKMGDWMAILAAFLMFIVGTVALPMLKRLEKA